jgi:DNA-binding response OmpR family regulator
MRSKKVLVIDDDVELLRLLTEGLARAGYEVDGAIDGRRGCQRVLAGAPDVVVVDIVMPTQEGIESIVAIRAARPDTRIVAMSGGGRIGPCFLLDLARHLGADATIAKPFRRAALIEAIEGCDAADGAQAVAYV